MQWMLEFHQKESLSAAGSDAASSSSTSASPNKKKPAGRPTKRDLAAALADFSQGVDAKAYPFFEQPHKTQVVVISECTLPSQARSALTTFAAIMEALKSKAKDDVAQHVYLTSCKIDDIKAFPKLLEILRGFVRFCARRKGDDARGNVLQTETEEVRRDQHSEPS